MRRRKAVGGGPTRPTPIYGGVWVLLSASLLQECSFRSSFLYLTPPTAQFLSHRKWRQSLSPWSMCSVQLQGVLMASDLSLVPLCCPSASAPHSQDWQPDLNESKKKYSLKKSGKGRSTPSGSLSHRSLSISQAG